MSTPTEPMPEKKVTHPNPAELRCRAEEQLKANRVNACPPETTAELRKLLNELQVSQIELEMQNAALQAERNENLALGTYAELYDFAPVGYLSLDKNRTIRSINFIGAELLGCERSLLIGRSFPCFLAENKRASFFDFLDRVVTSADKGVCEVTLLNHAGTPHFVRIEATGSPSGEECHVVLFDITGQKRAEAALLASEQLYRAIGESIDYGVWVCAPDGSTRYASDSFLRLVGLTQEQCSAFDWGNVLHPDDAERTVNAWQECVRSGGVWDSEFRFRGIDGNWHPVLARGVPVRDDRGEVIYWAGINLDISRMKQSEAALRESETWYRALFKNMSHGFAHCRLLYDKRGDPVDFIYLEVNEAFSRLTGLDNVTGKWVTEVIPGIREAHPELFVIFGRVALSGLPETFELEFTPLGMWFNIAVSSSQKDYIIITFGNITERKRLEYELRIKFEEISTLKQQVEAENVYLRAEIRDRLEPGQLIGSSAALRQVLAQAELAAPTDTTVLIQGETGTGKELIARYLHQHSNRSRRNLCILSCAAIPATLLESELFGHEKGSFTGALDRRLGHFEVADQSTIFLDEIGELPLEAQAKLLRVLQEGEFCRVGSSSTIKTDVRIIAATNRDLANEVREGRFREDLYYRLSVFPLSVPPLRERSEDIPSLVWAFVYELGARMGKSITRINAREMTALQQYVWPGNIRELRNVIEHALIFSRGDTLQITLPATHHPSRRQSLLMQDVEYQHITEVLRSTNWRVDGPKGAARLLGLHPNTLHSRIKKLGISTRSAAHDIS